MSDRMKSLLFAVVMCLVSSVLLTAAATGLQRFQAKNIRLDKQKNVLQSVGLVPASGPTDAPMIERLYDRHIRRYWVHPDGEIVGDAKRRETDLPLYLHLEDGRVRSFIIPVDSRGLWGRIKGYLAIKNDGTTVAGFSVYSHSETPGLGGEIEKNWFRRNFVDKKIVDQAGNFVSVSIAKGKVAARIAPEKRSNYVDGISGATLTGQYLSVGMRDILRAYEPVSLRLRGNRPLTIPGIPVP